MRSNVRDVQLAIMSVGLTLILSCNFITGPQRTPEDPSAVATGTALSQISASLTHQQLTLESMPTETATPIPTLAPSETLEPTRTDSPSSTSTGTAGTPLPLVLDVQTSADTFYCYDIPFELTITVKVSDIERGMAVYYYIQDKRSGATSEQQVIDLHRKTGDTRNATIIGGGSDEQNLQFPPLMGEAYFMYQIISDDGSYRSQVYGNVTFFPCAQ